MLVTLWRVTPHLSPCKYKSTPDGSQMEGMRMFSQICEAFNSLNRMWNYDIVAISKLQLCAKCQYCTESAWLILDLLFSPEILIGCQIAGMLTCLLFPSFITHIPKLPLNYLWPFSPPHAFFPNLPGLPDALAQLLASG